eukprot:5478047-Heterocapsa_arctica.AAC.1
MLDIVRSRGLGTGIRHFLNRSSEKGNLALNVSTGLPPERVGCGRKVIKSSRKQDPSPRFASRRCALSKGLAMSTLQLHYEPLLQAL